MVENRIRGSGVKHSLSFLYASSVLTTCGALSENSGSEKLAIPRKEFLAAIKLSKSVGGCGCGCGAQAGQTTAVGSPAALPTPLDGQLQKPFLHACRQGRRRPLARRLPYRWPSAKTLAHVQAGQTTAVGSPAALPSCTRAGRADDGHWLAGCPPHTLRWPSVHARRQGRRRPLARGLASPRL